MLKSEPAFTQVQVADRLGLTRKQVQASLKQLQNDGLLIREGAKNGGRWIVQ